MMYQSMMKAEHRIVATKQGNKIKTINKDELLDSIGTTATLQITRCGSSSINYRYEADVWSNRRSSLGFMGLYGIQDP